jgi:hypothetical protein
MVIDCYFEELHNSEDDTDTDTDTDLENFLKAYREGYINDTFSLIYQNPGRSTGELVKLVESYTPRNREEENLLITVKQGIDIINTGKNIFSYLKRPKEDDDNF